MIENQRIGFERFWEQPSAPMAPAASNGPGSPQQLRLLRSTVRTGILEILRNGRGLSLTQLCRERNLAWGSAQHHLHLLEQAGLVYSVIQGRNRLFFHPTTDPTEGRVLAHLATPTSQRIGSAILANPGAPQHVLCGLVNVSRKGFRFTINNMEMAGLVLEERRGRLRLYWPTELLKKLLPRA